MGTPSKILAAPLLVTLAACVALKSPPSPDEFQPQALPGVVVPERWGADGQDPEPVIDGWATGFGDAKLNTLIAEALLYNPDLLVAAARVEAAAQYHRARGFEAVSAGQRARSRRRADGRRRVRTAGRRHLRRTGRSISGDACVPEKPRTSRATNRPSPTPNTHGNRSLRWSRSRTSSRSRRGCSSRSPRKW